MGVLAETEKPGVDLVQSPLINPEALPDNHLLEENDLPRRSRTFDFLEDSPENPEDPFGENFGRGKTMILTMAFGLYLCWSFINIKVDKNDNTKTFTNFSCGMV